MNILGHILNEIKTNRYALVDYVGDQVKSMSVLSNNLIAICDKHAIHLYNENVEFIKSIETIEDHRKLSPKFIVSNYIDKYFIADVSDYDEKVGFMNKLYVTDMDFNLIKLFNLNDSIIEIKLISYFNGNIYLVDVENLIYKINENDGLDEYDNVIMTLFRTSQGNIENIVFLNNNRILVQYSKAIHVYDLSNNFDLLLKHDRCIGDNLLILQNLNFIDGQYDCSLRGLFLLHQHEYFYYFDKYGNLIEKIGKFNFKEFSKYEIGCKLFFKQKFIFNLHGQKKLILFNAKECGLSNVE